MDMSPHDEESITANDATVKDMEVTIHKFPVLMYLAPYYVFVFVSLSVTTTYLRILGISGSSSGLCG